MTAPVAMTQCPTEETLAAFIDDRLDRDARQRVIEHMVNCGDCRDVILTVPELLAAEETTGASTAPDRGGSITRFTPRAMFNAAAVLAAAAVLIVVFGPMVRERLFGRSRGTDVTVANLVRIVETEERYRSVDSRLTGGFPHKPTRPAMRGGSSERRQWSLMAEAGRLEALVKVEPTRNNYRALATTYVLLGQFADAVNIYESLLMAGGGSPSIAEGIDASTDVPVLIDLSAAYYGRAVATDKKLDLFGAVHAADRALTLEPESAEAIWNRAAALQALGMIDDARAAWTHYIEIDPRSAWTVEAGQRLRDLAAPTQSQLWERDRLRVDSLVEKGATAEVERLVRRYPQQSRTWVEETILPAWGEAIFRDRRSNAIEKLRIAEAVGDALQGASGEAMIYDTVTDIRAASSEKHIARLAAAFRAFGEARRLYRAHAVSAARVVFGEAETAFLTAGSPFSQIAGLNRISCQYYRNEYDSVREQTTRALDAAIKPGYHSLTAQLHWLRGLANVNTGRPQTALEDYEMALSLFRTIGEDENVLAIHQTLADAHTYLGNDEEAFRNRYEALKLLARTDGFRPRRYSLFIGIAKSALRSGARDVAILALNRLAAEATEQHVQDLRANGLLWRSAIRDSIGDTREAELDRAEARNAALRVTDDRVRMYTLNAVEFVREEIKNLTDPAERKRVVEKAIAYAREANQRYRLANLYLLQASEYIQESDDVQTEAYLSYAIDEIERQRGTVSDEELRASYFDARADAYDALIDLYARQDKVAAAFGVAERASARTLLDRLDGDKDRPALLAMDEIQALLPEDVVLIRYHALPKRLLIWILRRNSSELLSRDLDTAVLEKKAGTFCAAINAGERAATRRAGGELYEALVRPWVSTVPRDAVLYIVPDRFDGLPFSALYDLDGGTYLIQRNPIMITASANVVIRCIANDRRAAAQQFNGVVVAIPFADSLSERLQASGLEAEKISSLYGQATVLRGRAATTDAFVRAALRSAIVHFGGHASTTGGRAILAFDIEDKDSLDEHAIRNLRFRGTRLVVLASCGSARNYIRNRQGLTTLANAFIAGGVPAVTGALWSVNDEETARLMSAFHRHVAEGLQPAEALRLAQISDIEMGAAPATWSAFVIIGGRAA